MRYKFYSRVEQLDGAQVFNATRIEIRLQAEYNKVSRCYKPFDFEAIFSDCMKKYDDRFSTHLMCDAKFSVAIDVSIGWLTSELAAAKIKNQAK